jgi:lysozyme family protein
MGFIYRVKKHQCQLNITDIDGEKNMKHDPIGEVLKNEGGYVNHPNDRGGPTKYGVTQKTLSHWLHHKASIQDVKALTEDEARDIYEDMYLTSPRIHLLPEPLLTHVLDMSINHGPRTAIKLLQRAINVSGYGPADVDGRLGPQTRQMVEQAIKGNGEAKLSNILVEERIKYYNRIVARKPSQKVFLKGWLNRARKFEL